MLFAQQRYYPNPIGKSDINMNAWGVAKVSSDVSLFSSSFTFNIDRTLWVPYEDGSEVYTDVALTRYSIVNGKMRQTSGATLGQSAYLMSRRHPRYQPNRGHLFSNSCFFPSKNAIGIRRIGLFNEYNGAFFELKDGKLYAVARTTINTVTQESFRKEIDISGGEIDLEKGNIFDIQMQWRGVGNIKYFIGNPLEGFSQQVAEFKHLNTSTELSISNPSLPVGYESINTDGTEVVIESGCVDVSTENGVKAQRSYASTATGELTVDLTERPMIAIRIPNMFGTFMNTRDIVLTAVTAFCDVNALVRVYYFRDPSAITATWSAIDKGFQERSVGTAVTAFNTSLIAKVLETRIPALDSAKLTNPDAGNADFYLTHGDYIFVTIQGKNNSVGGVTIEFAEEIA